MNQDDDRLESALKASMDEVDANGYSSAGSAEGAELSSLVQLAKSIRELPHPERDTKTIRDGKGMILAAARQKKPKQSSLGWSRNGGFTGQWMVLPAVAGAALLILMVVVLSIGAGLYFSGPRGANTATLNSPAGIVEILDSEDGWVAVTGGHRIKSGQRVRTGENSQVMISFFDGTEVTLESNTDMVLSKIAGDWGKKLQVAMVQNEGASVHTVVPLSGIDSEYSVLTPSGEASVEGTSFRVLVEETGNSIFSVESGAVLVSNNGEQAFLAAGQGMLTELGEPLAAPGFLFALQGELQDNSGKTWVVEGVSITVKGGTRIAGDPQVGDIVLVNGRISKKNEWIADSIQEPLPGDDGGIFTGYVTGISEGGIEINGFPFVIQDDALDANLGDVVRVQFLISEGNWVVLNLEVIFGSEAVDPELEPDPPLDTEADLHFNPEKVEFDTCEPGGPVSATLISQTDQDLEVSLVVTVEKGGDYLQPIAVSPDIPFTIEAGGAVPITLTIALIEGLDKLPEEGEVEIRVTVQDVSAQEIIGDSFEFKWECDEELEEEEEKEYPDDNGDKCTREEQHPHALTLAAVYGADVGVDYNQIWTWFCVHNLGFGEIELAFKLTLEYRETLGIDVYTIIAKRLDEGLGWGQIKQELKQAERELLVDDLKDKKVPPGKEKSEEAKNKDKPNKKDD